MPLLPNEVGTALESENKRYVGLDVLRGFALLGILIMNIQAFSMILEAYYNPTAYGDLTGLNLNVWLLSHVFADSKFVTLFSLLFGASVVLFTERIEAQGGKVASLYYRRMGWLIVFGILHAYLLWDGDILYTYGMCGLVAYFFRKKSAKTTFCVGLVLFAVVTGVLYLLRISMPYLDAQEWASQIEFWQPSPETVEYLNGIYRGGWQAQMVERFYVAFSVQTYVFATISGWSTGGLMLMGMAFYRWRILTAERADAFYYSCMVVGFLIGLPIICFGVYQNFSSDWSFEYSAFLGSLYNYWGSLIVSIGYIGLIMLAVRRGWMPVVIRALEKIGRTSLSNYFLQTVICTTIFYGHGFGLFGHVSRGGQMLIVFGVWMIQIFLTHWWLSYYRVGPMEWLWRSLTYMKKQPLRK